MKNCYILVAAWMVFFTPLSMRASENAPMVTGIFSNEQRLMLALEGVTVTSRSNALETDTTAPIFTACPTNIIKTPTTEGACWTVNWAAPAVIDNCGTPTIAQTAGPTNGSCLTAGTHSVTYKATDTKGNAAICTFDITVNSYFNSNSITSNMVLKSCINNISSFNGSTLVERRQAIVVVCLLSNWLLKVRLFKVI
jgi:HYR domain